MTLTVQKQIESLQAQIETLKDEVAATRNVLGIMVTAAIIGRPLGAGEKRDLQQAFDTLNELLNDSDKR